MMAECLPTTRGQSHGLSPMRVTLGSNDLLEYNPDYGVLICRDCEYAIQKSAVQSHLLRHKIYRGERQNLLSSIAQFELREPDDVILPRPDTIPIAALPVLDGYRCLHNGCNNLCASVKRMRKHWADVHRGGEIFGTMAREVKMQTFFRGTKIRYFEVSADQLDDTVDADMTTEEEDALDESESLSDAEETENEQVSDLDDNDEDMEDAENTSQASTTVSPRRFPPDFDLGTLKTFHHFISVTSHTLPTPHFEMQSHCYWQTVVLTLAYSRHWLMSGLLAISEYHASMLTKGTAVTKSHREQALLLFDSFITGRRESSKHVCGTPLDIEQEEERRVGGQLMCILRCTHWALTTEPMLDRNFTSFPFKIQNFITALRSFSLVERVGNDSTPEKVFARASRVFKEGSKEGYNEKAIALLRRFDQLPSHMSDFFGRPNSVKDTLATLTAIASLVEHYSASFATDSATSSPTVVWHSMVQWLGQTSDHFRDMISRHDPAALVVVAFWASALVLRAEQSGHWFLSGLAKRLISEVDNRLRSSGGNALLLIEGLISEDFTVLTTF